jgi:hypothetical protein
MQDVTIRTNENEQRERVVDVWKDRGSMLSMVS